MVDVYICANLIIQQEQLGKKVEILEFKKGETFGFNAVSQGD
jgi:hypothetical protein